MVIVVIFDYGVSYGLGGGGCGRGGGPKPKISLVTPMFLAPELVSHCWLKSLISFSARCKVLAASLN